ncbi:MAG: hypothetical protein HOY78_22200 [Saccharothrix sp.]|nr:hypothetical protein [Saccharothrix sp.]
MRRKPGEPVAYRLARLTAALALSASALFCAGVPAQATPARGPVDIPDYAAALALVKSTAVLEAVCRFLTAPVPQGLSGEAQVLPEQADPCKGLPTFTLKDPLAVNEITPGFVAGTSPPVAVEAIGLSHLVSSLTTAVNGRQATVMLAPTQGGGWHLAAVREGDGDFVYAGKAVPGSLVFSEPQMRAWYQLMLLTVTPLNDQAREGLGGRSSMSLSEYQKLVKARYADKQPGSEYDTNGFSSGYGTASGDTPSVAPLVVGGSGVALVGGFLLLRSRRRRGNH